MTFQSAYTIGGTGTTQVAKVVVDNAGNIYVTGGFTGTIQYGAVTVESTGGYDFFVAKLDPSGNVLWFRVANGSSDVLDELSLDGGLALAVDNDGNVYAGGSFVKELTFVDEFGNEVGYLHDGRDEFNNEINLELFVVKYDDSGNFLWAAGGESGSPGLVNSLAVGVNSVNDIVIDDFGDPNVVGSFSGTNLFDETGIVVQGESDFFVASLFDDGEGTYWMQVFGTPNRDYAKAITIDANGYLNVLGVVGEGRMYLPGGDVFWDNDTGNPDTFFMDFDVEDGDWTFAYFMGAGDEIIGSSIATSSDGNIFVAGFFEGEVLFESEVGDDIIVTSAGDTDGFLAKYDDAGDVLWVQQFGAAGTVAGVNAIILDDNEDIIVLGRYWEYVVFDAESDTPVILTTDSELNMFMAKYDKEGNFLWAKNVEGSGAESTDLINDLDNPDPTRPFGTCPLFIAYTSQNGGGVVMVGDFDGTLTLDGITLEANPGKSDGNRLVFIGVMGSGDGATTYYYSGTGNLTNTANWGVNTDGSGDNPANFTSDNQVFVVDNTASATLSAAWEVSGVDSKVVVSDGTSLILQAALTASVDVASGGSLTLAHETLPTLDEIDDNSTVTFTGAANEIPNWVYGNLIFEDINPVLSSIGFMTIRGDLTLSGSVNMPVARNNVQYTFVFAGEAVQTLTGNGNVMRSFGMEVDKAAGSVEITDGTVFIVEDELILRSGELINNGSLVLASTAFDETARVSGIGTGTITGNITLERWLDSNAVPGSGAFFGLGSPVQTSFTGGTDAGLLSNIWTQGGTGANAENADPNVWFFNETYPRNSELDPGGWTPVDNFNSSMLEATGYLTYIFTNDVLNQAGSWPKVLSATGAFSEKENDESTVSFPVTFTDNSVGDSQLGGFNLVSNPYLSALDWNHAAWNRTHLEGTFWVLEQNGTFSAYTIGSGGTGIANDGIIASNQAFFVQANGETPVLSVTSEAKVAGTSFMGETEQYLIRVKLTGAEHSGETLIAFHEGVEARGAVLLPPFSTSYSLLYSTFENNRMIVNGIGLSSLQQAYQHTVPLYTAATSGGLHRLIISEIHLPEGVEATLFETQTGTIREIGEETEVTFYASPTTVQDAENRFNIILTYDEPTAVPPAETPSALTLRQNYPNPFNPTTVIRFELPATEEVRLEVFNVQGQRVATLKSGSVQAGVHTVSFDASALSSGVYLYRLQAGNQVITRKMTLLK
ncbi:T9SS type A sorting domain-containing protein [Cyclonatronum proteinivorum]|uniref:T9SS type A sorting domain-containing protein n=1 Tax=Cyclonatronum proteinivorum TaxID=1457365 RepID=UPI001F0C9902|nr:T9SS type A sorting domain-containing protein [Cyclonatronum proteinivorum]